MCLCLRGCLWCVPFSPFPFSLTIVRGYAETPFFKWQIEISHVSVLLKINVQLFEIERSKLLWIHSHKNNNNTSCIPLTHKPQLKWNCFSVNASMPFRHLNARYAIFYTLWENLVNISLSYVFSTIFVVRFVFWYKKDRNYGLFSQSFFKASNLLRETPEVIRSPINEIRS